MVFLDHFDVFARQRPLFYLVLELDHIRVHYFVVFVGTSSVPKLLFRLLVHVVAAAESAD